MHKKWKRLREGPGMLKRREKRIEEPSIEVLGEKPLSFEHRKNKEVWL